MTQLTHTIHIPVMEKADRLTGRTIQAVIGLAVSWLCPKHGVRGGLRAGVATQQKGSSRGRVGVWGHLHTGEHTGIGGDMRGQKGEWHSSSAPQGPATSRNLREGGAGRYLSANETVCDATGVYLWCCCTYSFVHSANSRLHSGFYKFNKDRLPCTFCYTFFCTHHKVSRHADMHVCSVAVWQEMTCVALLGTLQWGEQYKVVTQFHITVNLIRHSPCEMVIQIDNMSQQVTKTANCWLHVSLRLNMFKQT